MPGERVKTGDADAAGRMLRRHLLIHGRVQGVGYRQSLAATAGALGLLGWVRNRRNGSVEALLEGRAERVEALTQWAQRGPPEARVDRIDRIDQPAGEEEALAGFKIHPTL